MYAAALVTALIVGPLGGFAIGRASTSGSANRLTAGNGTPNGSAARAGKPPHRTTDVTSNTALDQLFTRTTHDGVTVRAYRYRWQCPPKVTCTTPGRPAVIKAELSTDSAVTLVTAGPSSSPTGASLGWVSSGVFGVDETAPAQWLLVQAGSDVGQVVVRFDSGATDRMAPVEGVAILAQQGSSGAHVEARGRTGELLDTRVVPTPSGSCGESSSAQSANGSESVVSGCLLPVTPGPIILTPAPNFSPIPVAVLPAPGVQPANPSEARARVIDAFTTAYKGDTSGSARAGAVDNNAGIAALLDKVAHGQYADPVKVSRVRVTQVVFTSPTEATALFDILLGSQVDFANRVGQAIAVNGTWKVTRSTICSDLARASAPCT